MTQVCRRENTLPLIPVDFYSFAFITSQETLEETGFPLNKGATLEDFLTSLKQYYAQPNTRQPLARFTPREFFEWILEYGGVSVLDYEKGAVTLDTPVFRQVAETYKLLYAREQSVPKAEWDTDFELVIQGKALFGKSLSGRGLINRYANIAGAGQTPVLFPLPTAKASAHPGMLKPWLLAGISQGSPNKLNVFRLLKIMLSKAMQAPGVNPSQFNTTRLDLLHDILAYKSAVDINTEEGVSMGQVQKAVTDATNQVYTLFTNAPATLGISVAVKDILWEELEPYFQGSRTLDDAIAAAQEKLKMYIAE